MIDACVWCENQNHALFFIWFGFENKNKTHFLVPSLSLFYLLARVVAQPACALFSVAHSLSLL